MQSMNALLKFIFPEQYRNFPYQRLILDLLRSGHILCVSLLLGGLYFLPESTQIDYWLAGVIITGSSLLVIEIYRSAAVLFELRGVTILTKLALLFYLSGLSPSKQLIGLMGLLLLSSMISHSTRRIRHHSLLPQSWQERLNIDYRPKEKTKA